MGTIEDGPVLWGARGVAEYAYCPRLFYYMQVEGVFLPSSDTEQGQAVHRRVNRPSAPPPAAAAASCSDEPAVGAAACSSSAEGAAVPLSEADGADTAGDVDPRPRAVRSLALTSERLGLTATLDLAEIEGRTAVPVEYRKGRPRRVHAGAEGDYNGEREPGAEDTTPVEPWPTDRVQVGLQVLLLEEHGYTVPHAVLYYAQERRRLVVPVDDTLRREALDTLDAARRTAGGPRPLPLVNDPKCPRCSLQPICLPDEVNHQRAAACSADSGSGIDADGKPAAGSQPPVPRRMWPPRDDGIHLVAQADGVHVGLRKQSLRFTDRHGEAVREMPIASIESLAVVGSVQVSTQVIHTLADKGVPVVFMTSAGRTVAVVDPLGPTSAAVRRAQVLRFSDERAALELARAVVSAKITNQRTLLMRNTEGLPSRVFDDLAEQAGRAAHVSSVESLLGHEGQAASIYFESFPLMIRDEQLRGRFETHGRRRRPPPDPVNAVLSFAYSMLTHECVSALRLASLEPAIGALHTTRPGRPALALDLMEPFRPLIADSIAISTFNRGELTVGHFLDTAAGCALTDAGRRAFFDAWGRRMATEVTHPVFDYRLSYRRMLMLHARLIAAWLLDEAPTLAFLTTR